MSASSGAIAKRGSNLPAKFNPESEVLEFQLPTQALINTPIPLAARRISWIVSALAISCMLVLAFFPIARLVTAPGRVVSLSPTMVLQPLEASIVRSINVREGQTVHKGDLLARLDPTFSGADEKQFQLQVQSFSAEVDRAQAELDGKPYQPTEINADTVAQRTLYLQRKAALDAQMDEFQQKIASLQQAAQRAESDMAGFKQRLAIATDVAAMRRQLEDLKVGSRLNTLSAEDTRLDLARQYAGAQAQAQSSKDDLMAQLHERDFTLQNWRADTSRAMTDAARKLADARETLAKATRRRELVEMHADRDAIVQWIAKVSPGSVMNAAEQLMILVPTDTRFEIEAKVPGNEVGFVTTGQKAIIKLSTLNNTLYGYAEGSVISLSPDSFNSGEGATTNSAQRMQGDLPGTMEGPSENGSDRDPSGFYRARISLDHTYFRNLPQDFHILPGMALTADIQVGKRTVLAYMLGRAAPVFDNAMTEP